MIQLKHIIVLAMAVVLMAFTLPHKKKIKIFLAGDSTMSIKEVKAYPETGWGMPFTSFWDSTVTIINKARNGRSTRTFISEGHWKSIADEAGEGDFVFIQFGHNDESEVKTERYTTPEQYKDNLEKFIRETRNKKANPVLLTPVSRRRFDKEGKVLQTHEIYSALVREIAKKQKLPLIDLDEMSRALYQEMGPDNSKMLFLQLRPGEHPNYPDGKVDNTHFNELGARLIAQLVLNGIREVVPELADRIVVPAKK